MELLDLPSCVRTSERRRIVAYYMVLFLFQVLGCAELILRIFDISLSPNIELLTELHNYKNLMSIIIRMQLRWEMPTRVSSAR